MNPRISFDPEARIESEHAFHWYEEQREGTGVEFIMAIEETLSRIADRPLSFPKVDGPVRRASVCRFPYGVYYVVEDGQIFVLAVFHAKRNPQTWRDRL